ncbi:MAG TPA: hypothetical protein VL989_03500 [Candidatus Sulfotelmatobacter sp.]|nr:hypothetical protein [Candidatus Sulfotelmatobacter sp.]
MSEKLNTPFQTEDLSIPHSVVSEIYLTPENEQDRRVVEHYEREILPQSDIGGKELYASLRGNLKELETLEGWKAVKSRAETEVDALPDDYLDQLLARTAPLIRSLPTGHSKGHFLRDTIHLTGNIKDPAVAGSLDSTELIAGITAGIFHDIGVSIVDRYQDQQRVGAHAEVGARLFSSVGQDIVPPNLSKLIQYSIAAHTHYLKPRELKLIGGEVSTAEPYDDTTDGEGDRTAVWLARQSDRRDASGVPFIVRNALLRADPVQDFDGEKFIELQSREESFKTQFGLGPEAIDKGILQHCLNYAVNFYRDNPYTSHDTQYFTETLITPSVEDLALFLSVVSPDKAKELVDKVRSENPEIAGRIENFLIDSKEIIDTENSETPTAEGIQVSLDKFFDLCRVIEPANDTEKQIESLREQFGTLSEEEQQRWSRGFNVLTEHSFTRWKENLAASIDGINNTNFEGNNPATQRALRSVINQLSSVAGEVLSDMVYPAVK